MDRRSLYDEDIYAWAQQQAATLRRLAETRRDLPNELDLENVAEEIEDVGRSELNKVESFIQLILVHLLKAASAHDDCPSQHWRGEVKIWRINLRKNLSGSMRPKINLEEAWEVAVTRAEVDLAKDGDQIIAGLSERCPFSLDDLAAERFNFDEAVERVRKASRPS
jgi:hypothetical protein